MVSKKYLLIYIFIFIINLFPTDSFSEDKIKIDSLKHGNTNYYWLSGAITKVNFPKADLPGFKIGITLKLKSHLITFRLLYQAEEKFYSRYVTKNVNASIIEIAFLYNFKLKIKSKDILFYISPGLGFAHGVKRGNFIKFISNGEGWISIGGTRIYEMSNLYEFTIPIETSSLLQISKSLGISLGYSVSINRSTIFHGLFLGLHIGHF